MTAEIRDGRWRCESLGAPAVRVPRPELGEGAFSVDQQCRADATTRCERWIWDELVQKRLCEACAQVHIKTFGWTRVVEGVPQIPRACGRCGCSEPAYFKYDAEARRWFCSACGATEVDIDSSWWVLLPRKPASAMKLRVGKWLGCDFVAEDVTWWHLATLAFLRVLRLMLGGP